MRERVGLVIRKKIVEEIKERLNSAQAYVFVGFSKLKAQQLNTLRDNLKKENSLMRVFKNSLIKRAFSDLGKELDNSFVEGPTGIVFVYEDIVKVCKLLVDFSKESEEAFYLKGGFLEEKKLNKEELLELAKLPPYEILLGKTLNVFCAPLTGFLNSLNQIILKFVWLVEEIKKKKEERDVTS